MHESLLLGFLYSMKELRKELEDLMELYEAELNSNTKKSEVIKDLQKRLFNEHSGRLKLLITLIRSREYITDQKKLEEIDKVLEPYMNFNENK